MLIMAPPACEFALCDSRAIGVTVDEGFGGMAIALNGEDIAVSGWVDRSTWSLLSGPRPGYVPVSGAGSIESLGSPRNNCSNK
jgi:hypothetical protein